MEPSKKIDFLSPWLRLHVPVWLSGILFALLCWQIMRLEPRYILAISAGIIVISLGMMSIFWLQDFLLYALFFNIPFASFGKWLLVQPVVTVAKGINFGLAEVLLFFAYFSWFCQIFIARSEDLPRLRLADFFVGIIFIAQCLSSLGAPDRQLAFFDIVYNLKFFMMYFFIAQKLRRRHLKFIVPLLLLGILVESPLALYERISGHVGIGRTKGDITSIEFGRQYEVPGLEQIRSEGTTKDSHTLGEYLAMLLPLPLIFLLAREVRPRLRLVLGLIFLLGLGGLIVTFSRAGWFSFALAGVVLLWIVVFIWRQGQAAFIFLGLILAASFAYPKVYEYAIVRILEAPHEILSSRYDMNLTALGIIQQHFFLGCGPGNYLEALSDPAIEVIGPDWLPVHNAFLYIASESGIVAALFFFAVIINAMVHCWRARKHSDLLVRGLAVAMFSGFTAYLLDGLTNPTFREAEPYSLLWLFIGISLTLPGLTQEKSAPDTGPTIAVQPQCNQSDP